MGFPPVFPSGGGGGFGEGVRVHLDAAQAVTNPGAEQPIDQWAYDPSGSWGDFDTDGFWSIANPEWFTIPPGLGGLYVVTLNLDTSGDNVPIFLKVADINDFFPWVSAWSPQLGGRPSTTGISGLYPWALNPGDVLLSRFYLGLPGTVTLQPGSTFSIVRVSDFGPGVLP